MRWVAQGLGFSAFWTLLFCVVASLFQSLTARLGFAMGAGHGKNVRKTSVGAHCS